MTIRQATYDPSTPAGQVRLIISDVDVDDPLFSDVEIDAFLSIAGGTVLTAAAQALDAIASNEAQVLKVVRTLDLSTDGAAVARALREHAKELRAQADGDGDDWAVAEFVDGAFAYRERVGKEMLRDGLF